MCVRKGSKYGLRYGNLVYELEPQAQAAIFAAENVRVTGQFEKDMISIRSIALAAKWFVRAPCERQQIFPPCGRAARVEMTR
jgi:hypothetical protein